MWKAKQHCWITIYQKLDLKFTLWRYVCTCVFLDSRKDFKVGKIQFNASTVLLYCLCCSLTVPTCPQVGWYNSLLPPTLRLAHPDDCLAVVVLSTPALFEQAFLPFMEERGCQGLSDPIDQCVKRCVSSAVSQVSGAAQFWLKVFTYKVAGCSLLYLPFVHSMI